MIDPETLKTWTEWARRDDCWKLFIPSDIRLMLGEIERLQTALSSAQRQGET